MARNCLSLQFSHSLPEEHYKLGLTHSSKDVEAPATGEETRVRTGGASVVYFLIAPMTAHSAGFSSHALVCWVEDPSIVLRREVPGHAGIGVIRDDETRPAASTWTNSRALIDGLLVHPVAAAVHVTTSRGSDDHRRETYSAVTALCDQWYGVPVGDAIGVPVGSA